MADEGISEGVALTIGFVGAGGAVVAGVLANLVAQWLTFRGQDRRRWHERRAEAFARFYAAALAWWGCYHTQDGALDATDEQLREAEREATSSIALVALLASKHETVDRADAVWETLGYLGHRRGKTWEEVDRAMFDALEDLMNAGRLELGLGKSPTGLPYETWRAERLDPPAQTEG